MPLSKSDCEELQQLLRGKALGKAYEDIVRFLRRAGFTMPGSGKGSHRTWVHPGFGRRVGLVDKGRGDLLPCYVKIAATTILELGLCDQWGIR